MKSTINSPVLTQKALFPPHMEQNPCPIKKITGPKIIPKKEKAKTASPPNSYFPRTVHMEVKHNAMRRLIHWTISGISTSEETRLRLVRLGLNRSSNCSLIVTACWVNNRCPAIISSACAYNQQFFPAAPWSTDHF